MKRMGAWAYANGAIRTQRAGRGVWWTKHGGLARRVILALAVALGVALLSACGAPSTSTPASSSAGFQGTQVVGADQVTLRVAPNTFGANTFTVTLKDTQGRPVQGANVQATVTMLDMDMGVQSVALQASSAPGVYTGQMTLPMAGHWGITVKVKPTNAQLFTTTSFKLTVAN